MNPGEAAEKREVSIGRVFARAWASFGDNAASMVAIAFVFGAIPLSFARYAFGILVPNSANAAYILTPMGVGATAIVLLGEILFGAFVEAAIMHSTLAHIEGRRASLGECLQVAASLWVPMVGLSALYLLGLTVAFIFLIIPGFIVWCVWFVAKPALIAERTSVTGAFGRTRKLTAFQGWKIFGILLVLFGAGVALNELAKMIARAIQVSDPVTEMSISYVLLLVPVTTFDFVLWATVQTSTYVELRDAREGPPGERLQEVFA